MCGTLQQSEKDNTIELRIETLLPSEYTAAIQALEAECGQGKMFPDGKDYLAAVSLWPFGIYADDVYGGLIFLEFTEDGTAIIHVGKMPWFPSSLGREALRRVLDHAFQWVDTVEAYIPLHRHSLARLARLAGFRIQRTKDHYHGIIALSQATSTAPTRNTPGQDGG